MGELTSRLQGSETLKIKLNSKQNMVKSTKKKKPRNMPRILRNLEPKNLRKNRNSKITLNPKSPKLSELFGDQYLAGSRAKQRSQAQTMSQKAKYLRRTFSRDTRQMTKRGPKWAKTLKGKQRQYLENIRRSNRKNRSIRVRTILKNQAIFEASQKNWHKVDNFRAGA